MQAFPVSPPKALEMLVEGNKRFVSGKAMHPRQSAERRAEVLAGQHPFATILSCADSRVPPEVLFDQGIGDLFTIRNAGNIVDDVVLGSIEYAVKTLGTGLVMVLGHTHCGAVTLTVENGEAFGHLGSLVETIQPAVEVTQGRPGDAILNAVKANAILMKCLVETSEPVLGPMVRSSRLMVVAGIYHLENGKVDVL